MTCANCRDALNAYLDDEVEVDEGAAVREHLAGCEVCARDYETLATTSQAVRRNLMRHTAPDVLKARIRAALLEQPRPRVDPIAAARLPQWLGAWGLAAAAAMIAVASSSITLVAVRHDAPSSTSEAVLASHLRSLQPGHLTDVVSTNRHDVKPWFNGRVDFSPTVPNLDSLGFPLVGGRLDYVAGRAVAVVVYARRQHMINVFSWPVSAAPAQVATRDDRGYHLVHWIEGGIEYWVTSDVSAADLTEFVRRYRRGG
jgi:anti-sigma factor RsiW